MTLSVFNFFVVFSKGDPHLSTIYNVCWYWQHDLHAGCVPICDKTEPSWLSRLLILHNNTIHHLPILTEVLQQTLCNNKRNNTEQHDYEKQRKLFERTFWNSTRRISVYPRNFWMMIMGPILIGYQDSLTNFLSLNGSLRVKIQTFGAKELSDICKFKSHSHANIY